MVGGGLSRCLGPRRARTVKKKTGPRHREPALSLQFIQ
jgi:hypothetical protein